MFLVEKRWEILKILASKPSSPLEIAENLGTTVSYVSQQLKLLEAMGLISKEKTGAAEKGKPRSIYSIKNEFAYFSILSKNFSDKKLINLTDHHQSILNIWLLENSSFHYPIEKFFWEIESSLDKIEGIFLEQSFIPKIIVITSFAEIKKKIETILKKLDKKIEISYLNKPTFSDSSLNSILPLHDPNKILLQLKEAQIKN